MDERAQNARQQEFLLLSDADKMKTKIERRKKFTQSFCFNLLSFFFGKCCCSKSNIRSYKKFQIAKERVLKEHDIQTIIAMNRITRIIHKSYFKSRQRLALAYSHKFMVTAADVDNPGLQLPALTDADKLATILDGFDPETDSLDRRILFEVTGFQLREGEFADEGTSDEDW